jgi:hypothetical protein
MIALKWSDKMSAYFEMTLEELISWKSHYLNEIAEIDEQIQSKLIEINLEVISLE